MVGRRPPWRFGTWWWRLWLYSLAGGVVSLLAGEPFGYPGPVALWVCSVVSVGLGVLGWFLFDPPPSRRRHHWWSVWHRRRRPDRRVAP